ncbi:hypothetical protein [Streptomyces sp. NPDC003832]
MSAYTTAWIAWGAAFAVTETLALVNGRKGDTLSENTRTLFHTKTSRAGRLTFAAGWVGFSVWFLGHILKWWP